MKLTITVCATASYRYALTELLSSITTNLSSLTLDFSTDLVIVTEEGAKLNLSDWKSRFSIRHLEIPVTDGLPNYKEEAQRVIAAMRTAAFDSARRTNSDLCWSLDSDVIPPSNALRCMMDMLNFDNGYYGVATCPYPSQSGGGMLFGRGTPNNHISEDVTEEERTIPDDLKERLKAFRALPVPEGQDAADKRSNEWKALKKELDECPPSGNVFALNAKAWRRRGWGEMAYPAIGKGAVVPTDWCGFGCTLMGREALARASFIGYEGKGTEDLWVVWRCWYPAGIRICSIPHASCSHVIRKDGKHFLVEAFHETEGECVGHLRTRFVPWVTKPE